MTTKTKPSTRIWTEVLRLGADELGQEGEEEEDHLDVEHVHDHAAHEDPAIGRLRANAGQIASHHFRTDGGNPHPDRDRPPRRT